jgi:hypothetical protein
MSEAHAGEEPVIVQGCRVKPHTTNDERDTIVDDKGIIFCRRVADLPRPPEPGSKIVPCPHCGEAMIMGPATVREGNVANSILICMTCIQEMAKAPPQ